MHSRPRGRDPLVCAKNRDLCPPISFPEPAFGQQSGNATALESALDDSNTGTRNFWFRFDSARASEIVVEMNKFQQPMRFGCLFGGLSV